MYRNTISRVGIVLVFVLVLQFIYDEVEAAEEKINSESLRN
jgi:hypothetical protein